MKLKRIHNSQLKPGDQFIVWCEYNKVWQSGKVMDSGVVLWQRAPQRYNPDAIWLIVENDDA